MKKRLALLILLFTMVSMFILSSRQVNDNIAGASNSDEKDAPIFIHRVPRVLS